MSYLGYRSTIIWLTFSGSIVRANYNRINEDIGFLQVHRCSPLLLIFQQLYNTNFLIRDTVAPLLNRLFGIVVDQLSLQNE